MLEKQDICPKCGKNMNLVGRSHLCRFVNNPVNIVNTSLVNTTPPVNNPVNTPLSEPIEVEAVVVGEAPVDRATYMKDYMRAKRAARKAARAEEKAVAAEEGDPLAGS